MGILRVEMKSFQLIILCVFVASIACDVGESLSSSEELELMCTFNITRRSINPQMEVFFANLRAKELRMLKNSDNRDSFRRVCKRVQLKLVAFQIKMVQELMECLRNETLTEYESYIKITNRLTGFVCNLDERRLKILGRIENYDMVMARGDRLTKCARDPSNGSKFDLSTEFCKINETKFFECSNSIFTASYAEPRTLLKIIWKFLNSLIDCETTLVAKKTKIEAKYVFNYLANLLIPTIQGFLRDASQRSASSTEEM